MEGNGAGGRNLHVAGVPSDGSWSLGWLACNRGLRADSGDLIERLVELRGEGRLVGEEREGKAEVRRGLGLNHIQRLAGGVEVLLQHPALYLRALIGEDDLVVLVFDRGLRHYGGGDGRRGCGCLHGAGGQIRRGWLDCGRSGGRGGGGRLPPNRRGNR